MKICFIGDAISNALGGDIVGGAEKQQKLIIEGLNSKGIDVVVLEYYLKSTKHYHGIDVHPAWHQEDQSFLKKLKRIIGQLKSKKVDVIYARGTQLYIAYLYFYLKITGSKIKFYWGLAGNHDLSSKFNYIRVNHKQSLYGKLNAGLIFNISSNLLYLCSDTIICQTEEQVDLCKKKWIKKPIVLVPNIYTSTVKDEIKLDYAEQTDAIWVGKFAGNKGEDILLRIARDIPKMKIICLGHVTDNFRKTKIYKEIEQQKNIILLGRVSNSQVSSYISKAKFILNTSPSEGFSNVFLEGWDLEKPVISFIVNPNEYLSKGEAGYCAAGSYENLSSKLNDILNDQEWISSKGVNGKKLLLKNHSIEEILPKYINLFSEEKGFQKKKFS